MHLTARPFIGLIVIVLLVGATAACSSDSNKGDDQPNIAGSGDDRSPTQVSIPASRPNATPTASASKVPTFAKGGWTAGEAEVKITGSDNRTVTGTLLARSSSSEGGTTRLTYTDDLDTINFSISTEYQPFSVTAFTEKGGRFSARIPSGRPPCAVTYTETSEKRIQGTFRCEGAEIDLGPKLGPAVIEGSFTATR